MGPEKSLKCELAIKECSSSISTLLPSLRAL